MAIQPLSSSSVTQLIQPCNYPLLALPVKLLLNILGHTESVPSVLACSQTCKTWSILMQKEREAYTSLWDTLMARAFPDRQLPPPIYAECSIRQNICDAEFTSHTLATQIQLPSLLSNVEALAIAEGKLYAASLDKTIEVWDLETDTRLHTLSGHTKGVAKLEIINNRLYSVSQLNEIKIWDLKTNVCLSKLTENDHSLYVEGFAYSGTKFFIAHAYQRGIDIWDSSTNTCVHTIRSMSSIHDLAVSDEMIIAGDSDGKIRAWDLKTYEELPYFKGHTDWVSCLAVGKTILYSGSHDQTVKIWDLKTKECLRTLEDKFFNCELCSLAIAEGILFSGYSDGRIKAWDLNDYNCLLTIRPTRASIDSLAFTEGKLIFGAYNKEIGVVDFNQMQFCSPKCQPDPPIDVQGLIYQNICNTRFVSHILQSSATCAKYSDIGSLAIAEGKLYAGSWDKSIEVWDLHTRSLLHTLHGHDEGVQKLAVKNGKLYSFSSSGELRIRDLNKHAHFSTHEGMWSMCVSAFWPSSEKNWIVRATGNRIEIRNVNTDTLIRNIPLYEKYPDGGAFALSEEKVFRSYYHQIHVWDLTTGRSLSNLIGHGGNVTCLTVANGRLYSGSHDQTIKVWDIKTQELLHTIRGLMGIPFSLNIAEEILFSGDNRGEIKAWDLEEHTCLATYNLEMSLIRSLAFADGKLIAGTSSKKILIFDFN